MHLWLLSYLRLSLPVALRLILEVVRLVPLVEAKIHLHPISNPELTLQVFLPVLLSVRFLCVYGICRLSHRLHIPNKQKKIVHVLSQLMLHVVEF